MFAKLFLVTIVHFQVSTAQAGVKAFEPTKKLMIEGHYSKAYKKLIKSSDSQFNKEELSLKYFTLGYLAQKNGKWSESKQFLVRSQKYSSKLDIYNHFLLAKEAKKSLQNKEAERLFNQALVKQTPRQIHRDVRFELSDLYIQRKQWRKAYKHLKKIERKWRYDLKRPEILWRLMIVAKNRHQNRRHYCKWARKLYTRYPSHRLVYEWGVDLNNVMFKGEKLRCSVTYPHMQKRIRRLQYEGESDRAKKEISEIRKSAAPKHEFMVDLIEARYLIWESYSSEALRILAKYYKTHKDNFEYLTVLAKAASRSDHEQGFKLAVQHYYSAYKLRKKSKNGRRSLFRAAFLSYQFQDYDGASRKFTELIKSHSDSKLSRDSLWHLAWIKYLKADYRGAATDYARILKEKTHRSWRIRRKWGQYDEDRIKYWLAMSYLNLKDYDHAYVLLTDVKGQNPLGYYPALANERLKTMSDKIKKRRVASLESLLKKEKIKIFDEDEINDGDEKVGVKVSSSRNKSLRARLNLAIGFIGVGLYDFAKWELYEAERRTSNKVYLKIIMAAYQDIGFYYRSSSIGAFKFYNERWHQGFDKARVYWEATYPQAYSQDTKHFSKKFHVNESLVWSIMRAESLYRKNVVSPVGAKGLLQIMPNTGNKVAKMYLGLKAFHPKDLHKPKVNIQVGTKYMQCLSKRFKGQIPLVAAAYNGGPHRVNLWLYTFGKTLNTDEFIEHIPFAETRNYVKKVIRNYNVYSQLYGKKANISPLVNPIIPISIHRKPANREVWGNC